MAAVQDIPQGEDSNDEFIMNIMVGHTPLPVQAFLSDDFHIPTTVRMTRMI